MPNLHKYGRERGYYNKKNTYYSGHEHDNRITSPNDGSRRVSFKNNSGGRNRRKHVWNEKIRSLIINDNDIDMSNNISHPDRRIVAYLGKRSLSTFLSRGLDNWFNYQDEDINSEDRNNQRGRKNNNNNNNPNGRRKVFQRMLPESTSSWYKVMIRCGERYERDFLLKLLANFIKPTPFMPIGIKIEDDNLTFIIGDHVTAESLLNADRKITVSDGWKLGIKVRAHTPVIELSDNLTATIKTVLSNRCNLQTKAMDLSKFHSDPVFIELGMFCPLNRANIMLAVVSMLAECIPDLVALNLDDNKLSAMEHMKIIVESLPHLKILHMARNKLRDVKQLDSLKGLHLDEINLDGNALCAKFQNQDDYVRAIRQRFPKLMKLDLVDLPPPIVFDVGEDSVHFPKSQMSFMCETGRGAEVARTFLEQYYQFFDSEDRSPLVQAYHDDALFSMDCYIGQGESHIQLSGYTSDSRNLFKLSSSEKRFKLLHRGRTAVLSALKRFPKTEHDPQSFAVDLVLFLPELIQLNVCGVYREKKSQGSSASGDGHSYRFFSRVFIIVPAGAGFCIVNEQLTVMIASQEQIRKSFKIKESAPSTLAAIVPPAMMPPPQPSVVPTKEQMVASLAMKTGMNYVWSDKCLTETNWDFNQAVFAFEQLQKAGTIPPEAFIK